MADITRAEVSMDASTGMFAAQITGLKAGEDLPAGAPCYIKGSDGLVYMADGSAADELAQFAGCPAKLTKTGRAVTLFSVGARFRYAAGLTPGARLYISATVGELADAATTGDAGGVARAIDDTDIQIIRAG